MSVARLLPKRGGGNGRPSPVSETGVTNDVSYGEQIILFAAPRKFGSGWNFKHPFYPWSDRLPARRLQEIAREPNKKHPEEKAKDDLEAQQKKEKAQ